MTSAEYLANLEPSCRVSCFVRTPEKLVEVIEAIDPFEDAKPCWDNAPLDGPAYLRRWEGIGANHKQFDDFHEFVLGACPCWNRSLRQIARDVAEMSAGRQLR